MNYMDVKNNRSVIGWAIATGLAIGLGLLPIFRGLNSYGVQWLGFSSYNWIIFLVAVVVAFVGLGFVFIPGIQKVGYGMSILGLILAISLATFLIPWVNSTLIL